jgi:hypothetical protein
MAALDLDAAAPLSPTFRRDGSRVVASFVAVHSSHHDPNTLNFGGHGA